MGPIFLFFLGLFSPHVVDYTSHETKKKKKEDDVHLKLLMLAQEFKLHLLPMFISIMIEALSHLFGEYLCFSSQPY